MILNQNHSHEGGLNQNRDFDFENNHLYFENNHLYFENNHFYFENNHFYFENNHFYFEIKIMPNLNIHFTYIARLISLISYTSDSLFLQSALKVSHFILFFYDQFKRYMAMVI